jgi:hypothetical protein
MAFNLKLTQFKRSYYELLLLASLMLTPFITGLFLYKTIYQEESRLFRIDRMIKQLNVIEAFDLRDLQKSDRLSKLCQIPLLSATSSPNFLNFVSDASHEFSNIRETLFSMTSSNLIEVAPLMQILELLYPIENKAVAKDLIVHHFKIHNDKNLSIQMSLIKREPR